jgi:hypothetical protein
MSAVGDARKRRTAEPSRFVPVERVQALTTAEVDILAAFVAGWFADHAELDRDRFLMLVEEAKAVSA